MVQSGRDDFYQKQDHVPFHSAATSCAMKSTQIEAVRLGLALFFFGKIEMLSCYVLKFHILIKLLLVKRSEYSCI